MVEAFKEKPDKETASSYLKEGCYYWNSGMFMFSLQAIEQELKAHAPEIYSSYQSGYDVMLNDFADMPDISIDYAVAEKSAQMALVPLAGIYWNDIGSWDAIAETFSDSTGNMYSGDVIAENCSNTMILGQERLIAGLDLQNLMVIDTPDVLLVAQKGKSQDVKQLVKTRSLPLFDYAAANKTLREQPFLYYVPANEVLPTDARDKVLVQGVMDLVILGEKTLLVDYKVSGADEKTLKERYSAQLELYAAALGEATGKYPDINEYVTALGDGVKTIIDQAGGPEKIKGVGIGAPNGNFFNGCIEFAPNLPWRGVIPLAQLISDYLGGIPVALTNDANAAAIGEMTYGAARGMKDFIVITLGTGVGSGIVIGGNLVYGHDGFAGELGHVIVRRNNGRPCGCGRQGCLETYASATGVARTAREFLEIRKDESLLRDLDPDEITSKDVYDAAMKNDKMALEIFEFTGNILGEAFADFVAFSSPEAIILFGGLAKSGDLIMNPIKRAMEKNMLKIYQGKTKLLFSQLKESDAAVLGASALGWEVKDTSAAAAALIASKEA